MEAYLSPAQQELRQRVRAFVALHLWERPEAEGEAIEEESRALVGLLAQEGLLRYVVPAAYGGATEAIEARSLCVGREELARGSSLADALFAVQGLGGYPIVLAGTQEQKQRYLPPIASGQHIAAFAVTEPQAGSDLASIETTAQRRQGSYRLNGTKRFISNAGIAHTYSVFAKTDPAQGARGLSAFVVEADTPGFSITWRMRLIAPHPIGELAFRDCQIPVSNRLGAEGEGMRIALRTLDLFRSSVGAGAVGLGQRAYEEALAYARQRIQFGQPLTEFQAIRFKLAEIATELQAARLLVYDAAWRHDQGQPQTTLYSAMAKLFATEAAQRAVDQALQIHGGMGVVHGTVVERLYREVRALRIYEGTSEIQHLVIANQLLRE